MWRKMFGREFLPRSVCASVGYSPTESGTICCADYHPRQSKLGIDTEHDVLLVMQLAEGRTLQVYDEGNKSWMNVSWHDSSSAHSMFLSGWN